MQEALSVMLSWLKTLQDFEGQLNSTLSCTQTGSLVSVPDPNYSLKADRTSLCPGT